MKQAIPGSSLEPTRGRWRCAWLELLALVAVLITPRPVAASELIWQGPPECAAGEPLRFAVERALGVPLERASRLDFEVTAEVSSSAASARLRVVTPANAAGAEPAEGAAVAKERVFVAPDCSKLVDTLAVAITLAIASSAPAASDSEPGGAAAPNVAPPSPAKPPPPATTPRAPDELDLMDGDDGVRPSVLFALVGDSGSLPSPAVGAALGLELGVGPIAVRALGTLLFEQRVHLASPDGDAAADLRSTFGTLQACANALTAASPLSLPICAGADAGLLSGSGVSISRPQRASAAWVAPRADAGLLWDIPSTRLRLDVLITAAAPLVRDEFVVHGIGAVHRASRVVGRAAVGLALLF